MKNKPVTRAAAEQGSCPDSAGDSSVSRRNFLKGSLTLGASLALVGLGPVTGANAAFVYPDIRPSQGVTKKLWLSHYMPSLKGTNLDTPVFFFESGKPGATALLIGGTHCSEVAAHTAALCVLENARVEKGRLIVIPYANRSGLSTRDTINNIPRWHGIKSRSGPRYICYGNRRTDPKDQKVPDPEQYVHPSGYVNKKGNEARNLNRCYPGLKDGTPTEQLAYGIIQLVKAEKADFCLDCHEASTPSGKQAPNRKKSGRLAYTLVSHPSGLEIAASAILDLEEDAGITMKLEESRKGFRGLSHLEIGDATDCVSFLSESPNPGQDWDASDAEVINNPKYPFAHRVGLHVRLFLKLAENYELLKDKGLIIKGLPSYGDLMAKGVGAFLN
ncbi:M14 family metallopeptidase [Dethiosulfatarculus sandiegensis]|uniref:Deacylase n=1 Tax=Dethiosulfatarculus sandiegensis TaxID=1429043 RepID=A0A0D2HJE7_9BACT|nr:M14 family metallopeptidase [Dethiosulfatarculus sandiegensis]KIX10793.1 hypothetical protein X474_27735 [Dethiosulfatarculus sandiegensis]